MKKRHISAMLAALMVGAFVTAASPVHAQTVADLLAKLPAQNAADSDAVSAGLLQLGPAGIQEVCAQLLPSGDDAKARFAVSGLANYAMQTGKETERLTVAQALLAALSAATDNEIKAFLITQLQLIGKDEVVDPLKPLLADERLCDPAVRALQSNPAPAALAALAEALPASAGKCRVSLAKALGEQRHIASAATLLNDAASEDSTLRRAALAALANIGAPEAEEILTRAAQAREPFERSELTNNLLLYAQRRLEAGDAATCEKICRTLMAERIAPAENNVPCAALSMLAAIPGREPLDELLAVVDSPNAKLRGTALRLAAALPGGNVTREYTKKLRSASPETRLEIAAMLGDRRDPAALPVILNLLKAPDLTTRLTAIEAATRIGGAQLPREFVQMLKKAEEPAEIEATEQALLRVPGEKMTDTVAKALDGWAAPAQVVGLDILAARRATTHLEDVFDYTKDADPAVRKAALLALGNLAGESDMPRLIDLLLRAATEEDHAAAHQSVVSVAKGISPAAQQPAAVADALDQVGTDRKDVLLRVLVDLGGDPALQCVLAETRQADPAVHAAAVRALADWKDVSAAKELLTLVQTEPDAALRDAVLAGYVRLGRTSAIAAEDKVWLYREALNALSDAPARKGVFEGLADVQSLDALKLAAPYLDDAALQADAAATAARIALPKKKEEAGLKGPEVAAILQKAAPLIGDAEIKQRVEAHVVAMPADQAATAPEAAFDETGFLPLFNGKDLTGWTGDMRGYVAEFGKLVCKETSHLNLFTEKPYRDFVLRFDFKLAPGANNGIGLRTPLMSHAAYDGMEIQILDDTADQYKDLHDYQFHGSIYGVVPAERAHLKPVGEWNSMEITAQGRRITINVNGAVTVDADLDQASANGTPDGKEHPGLKNEAGHLALLGHGSRVEFRNLRIKELN